MDVTLDAPSFCNSGIDAGGGKLVYYPGLTWRHTCLNCGTILSVHSRGPCPSKRVIKDEDYAVRNITPQMIDHLFLVYYRKKIGGI